jgi:queuine tRNA-ribosyltransferase
MGVGRPEDIEAAVEAGVDLFDCVVPTREGRHGAALTAAGRLNIRAAAYRDDGGPLETGCACATCRTFSRAYLRHLFMAAEPLGGRLLSLHNVHYLQRVVGDLRERIVAGKV